MKKTKTSYKMYPAWAFDREVRELDEQSKKGWQLQKGGCFHSQFVYDDTVRYRYALDFNQDVVDPDRYRETFAEQGWEFVNSTFNGWHYFRKKYDPALPQEEYLIYTDESSIQEMAGRFRRLAYILGGIELGCGLLGLAINLGGSPRPSSILIDAGAILLGVILLRGGRRIAQSTKNRFFASGWVLLPVLILFLAAWVLAIGFDM